MIPISLLHLHVFKTILANEKLRLLACIIRERTEVPGVDLVLAELDFVDILDFGQLVNRFKSHQRIY